MSAVYLLTLRQLSGRWRILIMTVLAAMPIAITLLMLAFDDAPSVQDFEKVVLSTMLAGAIAPLIVLALAGPAFGNEVEDRTLANLTLAPIARWRIVVPKLLGTLTVAAPFMVASALVTAHAAFLGDSTATVAVAVGTLVGVALYAAAFLWLGLVSPMAIGVGLLYIVLWEGFFAGFVSGARILSIRHYAIALMHGIDPRRFAGASHPSLLVAVIVSAVLLVGFTLLAIRRLRRMDVP